MMLEVLKLFISKIDNMKIILEQNQLGNIFSKLSRTPYNPSLLQKFRTLIGDDQTFASIILKAANDGNISNVEFKSPPHPFLSSQIKFNVGNVPVIIYESYDYDYTEYSIGIPVISMERTEISSRIGKKIWDKLTNYNK